MQAMLLPLLLAVAAADSSWEVPVPDAAGPWAGLTEERIKKMPLSEVLSLLRNEHGLLSEQKQLWDQLNSGEVKLVQARQKLLDALDEAPSAAEPEREEPWTGVSAASIERLRMTELLRLLSRQELLGAGQERVVEDLQAGDMTLGGVRLLLKKRYDAAHNKGVSKANPWGEITIGWLQTKATALDVLRLLEEREGPPPNAQPLRTSRYAADRSRSGRADGGGAGPGAAGGAHGGWHGSGRGQEAAGGRAAGTPHAQAQEGRHQEHGPRPSAHLIAWRALPQPVERPARIYAAGLWSAG